ncbi:MAG: peroxide stress protein YaaA, partial [Rhodothermales bacterium]|nr:peroxide stress protein YaaA [Rhodothermales bacterium]
KKMIKVSFAVDSGGKRTFLEEGPLAGQFVNFIVREAAEDLELARQWVHSEGYKFDADAEHLDEDTRVHQIVYAKRA